MSPRQPAAPLAAYVLHGWDWSESSLIVELFTRERGRVVVAAKGAKRPHSQLRAVLVPFQRLAVTLGRAPADEAAEVRLLRSAERIAGPPMPPPQTLFAAYYANELLLRLTARMDAHANLFDRYAWMVESLRRADDRGIQAALRSFELALLRELGLLPELHRVTLTVETVSARTTYRLHPEAGVVEVPDGAAGVDGATLAAIERALHDDQDDALLGAVAPAAAALRPMLQHMLHYHLGSSPLRTRQVLSGLRSLIDREGRRP